MALRACTIAYPMRWVKETFPPRARLRWLLITMRLSNRSFTGTARTDVAVGRSSEAFMFFATAAEGPRRVTSSGPAGRLRGVIGLGLRLGRCRGLGRGGLLRGRRSARCGLRRGRRGLLRGRGGSRGLLGRGACGSARGGRCGRRCGRGGRGGGLRGVSRSRGGALRRLARRRGTARLVVGEEVPPGSVYRVRVLEVLLVDLVDEPLIGTERSGRVLSLPLLVGRDARAVGGL